MGFLKKAAGAMMTPFLGPTQVAMDVVGGLLGVPEPTPVAPPAPAPAPIALPDQKAIAKAAKKKSIMESRRRASRANVRLTERQSVAGAPAEPLGA